MRRLPLLVYCFVILTTACSSGKEKLQSQLEEVSSSLKAVQLTLKSYDQHAVPRQFVHRFLSLTADDLQKLATKASGESDPHAARVASTMSNGSATLRRIAEEASHSSFRGAAPGERVKQLAHEVDGLQKSIGGAS